MNFILEVPRKEPVDPCRPRHPGGMQEYAWENLVCHPPCACCKFVLKISVQIYVNDHHTALLVVIGLNLFICLFSKPAQIGQTNTGENGEAYDFLIT